MAPESAMTAALVRSVMMYVPGRLGVVLAISASTATPELLL
jgi:hypothetical protein